MDGDIQPVVVDHHVRHWRHRHRDGHFQRAENTGAQRAATLTIGGVAITVTARPRRPWCWSAIRRIRRRHRLQLRVQRDRGDRQLHLFIRDGRRLPAIGIQLNQNGTLTGHHRRTRTRERSAFAWPTAPGANRCRASPWQRSPLPTGGAANGSWGGNIALAGRLNAAVADELSVDRHDPHRGQRRHELVISGLSAPIFNDVKPLTIVGQRVSFQMISRHHPELRGGPELRLHLDHRDVHRDQLPDSTGGGDSVGHLERNKTLEHFDLLDYLQESSYSCR